MTICSLNDIVRNRNVLYLTERRRDLNKPRSIGFAIKAACHDIKRFMDNITQDSEVTGMQRGILYFIGSSTQDVFQRDIEKKFNIRRSSVSGTLQLLEQNGFITREPVDYDARLKKLSLTDKAVAFRSRMVQEIESIEKVMAQGLSQEELELFFSVLEKISDNITQSSCGIHKSDIV